MPGRPAGESVYQLRVVLAGISPLIWRRLQVTGSTTLAGLVGAPVDGARGAFRPGSRWRRRR